MSSGLYPSAVIRSVYDIDFKMLYSSGIRGIIFDIDNTLVPHGAPADERATALFARLRETGFETVLLSNNKEPRVRTFAEAVGSRYIFKGGKPSASGYMKAMTEMGTDMVSTVSIGDQIFTDTWGASNAGIRSILVHRIDCHEEIQIHLKRILEAVVMGSYYIFNRPGDVSPEKVFGGK